MTEARIKTVDVSNYELAAALRHAGCPMCAIRDLLERRTIESFVIEGHRDRDTRTFFLEAGGFCSRHAWALEAESERIGSGAVIADLYGRVAERDLAELTEPFDASEQNGAGGNPGAGGHAGGGGQGGGRRGGPQRWWRRRSARVPLERPHPCQLCTGLAEAERRQSSFLIELLADDIARERYAESDGLCFGHLQAAVMAISINRAAASTGSFLLDDWRRRLSSLRSRLASYDRNRDERFAEERTQSEHDSWTDVIERYAGPNRRD